MISIEITRQNDLDVSNYSIEYNLWLNLFLIDLVLLIIFFCLVSLECILTIMFFKNTKRVGSHHPRNIPYSRAVAQIRNGLTIMVMLTNLLIIFTVQNFLLSFIMFAQKTKSPFVGRNNHWKYFNIYVQQDTQMIIMAKFFLIGPVVSKYKIFVKVIVWWW